MSGKITKKSKNRIKFIVNPEAGESDDRTGRLELATQYLIQQGFRVDTALAKPKEMATRIARKAVRKGYRTVVVMGGDGTIEAVARELIGTKVRLGLLPGGTENNLAKSLGIPEDLPGACRLIREGTHQKIDAGQIRTKKGKKMYFLELAAVGLIADLFPEGKGIAQGKWGKLGAVVSKFAQYEPAKVTIKLDGLSEMAVNSLLVTISNAPSFGQGFLVAPAASMDDGLLDVNLYPNLSKAEVAAYFVEISGEKGMGNPKVEHYQARRITLRTDPKQPIMADGIMLGKGKLVIKASRNALRVIGGAQRKPVKNANQDKEEKLGPQVTPASNIRKTEPVK